LRLATLKNFDGNPVENSVGFSRKFAMIHAIVNRIPTIEIIQLLSCARITNSTSFYIYTVWLIKIFPNFAMMLYGSISGGDDDDDDDM